LTLKHTNNNSETTSSFRTSAGIMTIFEAEALVAQLRRFDVAAVGGDAWMAQHDALEQLNIQAHHNALTQHDEFVKEAFVKESGAVELLVHELIVIETWRERLFPLLRERVGSLAALKMYMVLYHEATLCNLLEVLCYHDTILDEAGDALLELTDYCYRKLSGLVGAQMRARAMEMAGEGGDDDEGGNDGGDAKKRALLDESPADTLQRQSKEIAFATACCMVSVLRFLTEHLSTLPVAVAARLLDTHDILLTLVPLVETPPWTRRRDGQCEKFVDQKWIVVAPADTRRLTKLEAQIWLCAYNLLLDERCRRQYELRSHRKQNIMRLRKFFNDVLMDQLPMLRQLHRIVEELSVVEPAAPSAASLAIIEAMPELRDGITKAVDDADLPAMADHLLATVFADDTGARRKELARLAKTYNLDNYDEVLEAPRCAECGAEATKRCARCKQEWYCSRKCQLDRWKKHKPLCDVLCKETKRAAAAAAAAATAAAADAIESTGETGGETSATKVAWSATNKATPLTNGATPATAAKVATVAEGRRKLASTPLAFRSKSSGEGLGKLMQKGSGSCDDIDSDDDESHELVNVSIGGGGGRRPSISMTSLSESPGETPLGATIEDVMD
jgi:predicted Zn-ribbon and HTH transcriptional regulator